MQCSIAQIEQRHLRLMYSPSLNRGSFPQRLESTRMLSRSARLTGNRTNAPPLLLDACNAKPISVSLRVSAMSQLPEVPSEFLRVPEET